MHRMGRLRRHLPYRIHHSLEKAGRSPDPKTREDLYDIIMTKKKDRLGKMKLTGKLIADAVLTKQTNLLKP